MQNKGKGHPTSCHECTGGVETQPYLFFSTRWNRVINTMCWLLYPQESDQVPTVQEAGWTQGQSGQVWKSWPPAKVEPQTFKHVVSRYINYAILAP